MAGRYSNPVPQYLDDNGSILPDGKLYFYVTGTNTLQDTFADALLNTPNSNPVLLDSAGRCPNIFASYEDTYRVVLKTSADVTVWTRDNVQFSDVQTLVTLAATLQAQINAIETVLTNSNPIRNSTTEVITAATSVTLTTSFLPHVAVGIDGRVASVVTAGTMTSGTLAGLGSTVRQAKMAGVSGDSSSIVEWRMRVSAAEARRFSDLNCSISALIRQESGVTATCTIALFKCDVADVFSAVTLVGSTSTNVTSGMNTTIQYAGLAVGDISTGIELVIRCQPGASFVTKDFYLTDIKLEVGATATDFAPASYPDLRADALQSELGVYRDTGTANAAVVATRDALSPYDGQVLTVFRPAGNSAAMTLSVDGGAALDVVYENGNACEAGDTVSGRNYRFRYRSATSKWVLENPSYNDGNLPLIKVAAKTATGAAVDFTGIPPWVKRITVSFTGLSTAGGNITYMRIGDSGGIETTGYLSSSWGGAVANATDAFFVVQNTNAAGAASGSCVLTLVDTNEWACTGIASPYGGFVVSSSVGSKTLSGTLDRLQLYNGASDTFDAGKVSIIYE